MSKGKLTRQELGWLLTQEAQGAAERLRLGVSALTGAPPAPGTDSGGTDASGVDATLSVLDDAMRMLSTLHARPVGSRGRRGRIDLASLLWEVAPEARVSIEPGSGTEVFGDEAELRRMLHVMVGHGGGGSSQVSIRREADEVVVSVTLGPDSSGTAATERSWLARMAVRYGGRWELEGSTEVLVLPADGVEQRNDVAKLRRELDEARRQGEAYARELAVVWTGGDEAPGPSTTPPPTSSADRYATVARLAGGVAASLRGLLSPIGREIAEIRTMPPQRKSVPEIDLARLEAEDRVESVRRRLLTVQELVADLASVGETDPGESARAVDLTEMVRSEVYALAGRAERAGVEVKMSVAGTARPTVTVPARAASVLLRQLVAHAIAASPRGSKVSISIEPPEGGRGARVILDDSGATLPAVARQSLVGLEVDPSTYARPSGVALFVAAAIAPVLPAALDLGDAPVTGTAGGGVRVVLTFAV